MPDQCMIRWVGNRDSKIAKEKLRAARGCPNEAGDDAAGARMGMDVVGARDLALAVGWDV